MVGEGDQSNRIACRQGSKKGVLEEGRKQNKGKEAAGRVQVPPTPEEFVCI